MDLVIIVVFIIVIFIIIVGIILYTCIKKTGNGNDNQYYGTGEVNTVKTEIKIHPPYFKSANLISEYINSAVTYKQNPYLSAELTFIHNTHNINIIVPNLFSYADEPVSLNKDGTMYYYFRKVIIQQIDEIYIQFAKCNDDAEKLNSADFLTQKQFDYYNETKQAATATASAASSATASSATADAESMISIVIKDDFSGKCESNERFTISSEMTFRKLFDHYCHKYSKYHIRSFLFAGNNLLNNLDKKIKEILYSSATIHAIGFKIYNENEMIEFIKNHTVNSTSTRLHIEPPFKIIVTMPSGDSGIVVLWHVKNKKFNWNKICNKVFGLPDQVKMYISEEMVMNKIIFYHTSLELFADCLNANGIEYNNTDKLLNLVKNFVNKDIDPDYATKMHIIQILFGVMSGYGIQSYQPDFVLNEHVTNAFSQYAETYIK